MKKELSLEEIKQIELNILLSFHSFCKEKNLQYSLCGGTLLGAVRHRGFIPWDDDIDVFMPRPDYESFRRLRKEFNRERYCIVDYRYKNDFPKKEKPYMVYPFIKIVATNTELQTEDFNHKKYYTGIWIDVFPVDGLPNSDKKTKRIFFESWLWRQFFTLKNCSRIKAKGVIQKVIKLSFLIPSKILTNCYLCKKLDSLSQTFKYTDSAFVGGIINGYGPQEKINKDDLEPMEVNFEGKKFMGIKGYDVYLTNLYGNYMELPPKEKRICHNIKAWRI